MVAGEFCLLPFDRVCRWVYLLVFVAACFCVYLDVQMLGGCGILRCFLRGEIGMDDRQVSKHLQGVAKALQELFGKDQGFMLVVFNQSSGGRTNYVSNCARDDVRKAVDELFNYWDFDDGDDVPSHEVN